MPATHSLCPPSSRLLRYGLFDLVCTRPLQRHACCVTLQPHTPGPHRPLGNSIITITMSAYPSLCRHMFCTPITRRLYGTEYNRLIFGISVMVWCRCLQELGVLTPVLETDNYSFAMELAVTAASNGALDLEQWLPALFAKTSDPFVTCLACFLHRKYDAATASPLSRQSAGLLAKVCSLLDAEPPV